MQVVERSSNEVVKSEGIDVMRRGVHKWNGRL